MKYNTKIKNFSSAGIMILLACSVVWLKWPSDAPETLEKTKTRVTLEKTTPVVKPLAPEKTPELALAKVVLPPPPAPAQPKPVAQTKPVEQTPEEVTKPTIEPIKKANPEKTQTQKIKTLRKDAPDQKKPAPEKIKTIAKKQVKTAEKPIEINTLVKKAPKKKVAQQEPIKAIAKTTAKPMPDKPAPVVKPIPKPQTKTMVADARAIAESRKTALEEKDEHEDWRQQADQLVTVSTTRSKSEMQEGRTLLRLLEHGRGPGIEIAWPTNASQQRALYARLNRCYGMVTAVMDSSGMLYLNQGKRGRPWQINMDAYSGFVRQPAGIRIQEEERQAKRIHSYHSLPARAANVRIFPRAVDAVMLGGLSRLIGMKYKNARSITAQYEMNGSAIQIVDIRVDGQPIQGRIGVEPISSCGGFA